MHAQIKASPDNTAANVQRILNALAAAGINIQAIARMRSEALENRSSRGASLCARSASASQPELRLSRLAYSSSSGALARASASSLTGRSRSWRTMLAIVVICTTFTAQERSQSHIIQA